MMDPLLTLWVLCVLSPLIFWCAERAGRALRARRRAKVAHGTAPGLPRDRPSLEVLVADLRRLELSYRDVESSNPPAKAARLRAISLAYDDVLCESCLALGLPPPPTRPLSGVDRLEAECELARHGLTW
jgi:hypothetical protein